MTDSVLLIYTGGTIGMYKTAQGSLRPLIWKRFILKFQSKSFDIELEAINIDQPIDSSNMSIEVWVQLAQLIEKNYKNYKGFVILHGSDTMAYTASALSFMLENLNKPVILTGAQLPIGVRRTDAKENIITSIELAAQSSIPEVCVYFEYHLLRGNRCTKIRAEHFEAFKSPNFIPLAEAGLQIKYSPITYEHNNKDLMLHTNFSEQVLVLKLFPSMKSELIASILELNYKGLILETFGTGNATTASWFLDSINKAIKKGKIILNISQCFSGSVSQGLYETSSKLEELGVVSGHDMTIEAAITKLMFLIGRGHSNEQIKTLLQISLRGELTN